MSLSHENKVINFSRVSECAREEYEKFLGSFLRESPVIARRGTEGVADLLFGDPHDPSLPEIAKALHEQVDVSQHLGYRYVHHMPEAREAATRGLSLLTTLDFAVDDLFLTTGAFAGLVCCLQAFCHPGSEVIFFNPPWFYYRSMIKSIGAIPKGIDLNPKDWSVPFDKVAEAINENTSAVILNSPHNPTGKVFSDAELVNLSQILKNAEKKFGRVIPLISDESYSRIVYDYPRSPSPARHYPATAVVYTYGKTLLAPSLRAGYVALAPGFPDAVRLRRLFDSIQPIGGWLLPSCLIQRALPQLDKCCINMQRLKARRNTLLAAFAQGGYRVVPPEGTFYMLVNSPVADDIGFANFLESRGVLVLPGSTMEAPGTFRVSVTASDQMIDLACEIFSTGY